MTLPRITTDRLLTTEQAAELLNTTTNVLDSWRHRKKPGLPYTRVGKSPRYRLSDLEAYLSARTVID